jgi:gluconolactonase
MLFKSKKTTAAARVARLATLLATVTLGANSMAIAQPARENHPVPPTVAPGAKLVVEYGDGRYFEGPTWDNATGKLYFTAFGKVNGEDNPQIMRLDARGKASVWMNKSGGVNGTRRTRDGRLIGAQGMQGRSVLSMKIGADGPQDVKTLTGNFEGVPYIGPNDVSESPVSGSIYFTDPNFAGKANSAVYHINAAGRVERIITNLKLPNGLLVSNDGKTLFVGDSFEKRIYSYPIRDDGGVNQGEVKIFFDPATSNQADPDGMTSDVEGNLYFAMRGGVWVASPRGESLGLIAIPEFCSNVCFGGADGKTLFMTCSGKVYSLAMNVRGTR